MIARLPAWMGGRPFPVLLLTGAASATGFAPLGLWPVTILSLALLLALLGAARTGRGAFGLGYAYGLGQFAVGLNWIAHAFTFQDAMPHWFGYGAVVLLSFYLAVYPAFATLLAWRLARGGGAMALTLALAGGWALTEYLRATLFTGFAWNPLGAIWLGVGLDQLARLFGTYGLATFAVMAGGALWMALDGQRRLASAFVFKLVAIGVVGWLSGHWVTPVAGPSVAIRVVQPNIPQDQKYDPQAEARNFARLATLSGGASASHPRLLFWPEAATSALLDMEPDWRLRLAALLGPGDLLMTGGDKYHFRKTTAAFYSQTDLLGANNSLWVLTPDARIAGRYDKAHLVPYGEYLPMRPLLSAIGLSRLVPGATDFWPGPGPRTLILPAGSGRRALRMGVQICYEMIFSGEVVDSADRPDFLFNPSNDAWFGSWGPPQHLAQARLRALEEAMPIVRSTPTGISAVIDATGRVTGSIAPGRGAALDSVLPPAAPPTLFARLGNVLPIVWSIFLIITGVALVRARR